MAWILGAWRVEGSMSERVKTESEYSPKYSVSVTGGEMPERIAAKINAMRDVPVDERSSGAAAIVWLADRNAQLERHVLGWKTRHDEVFKTMTEMQSPADQTLDDLLNRWKLDLDALSAAVKVNAFPQQLKELLEVVKNDRAKIHAHLTAKVEEATLKGRERGAAELEALAGKFDEADRREYCAGRPNPELRGTGDRYRAAASVVRNSRTVPPSPSLPAGGAHG